MKKLKLTPDQAKEVERARHFFDLGSIKEADKILEEVDTRLSHISLRWTHDDQSIEEKKAKDYIVTRANDAIMEDKVVLHQNEKLAASHGARFYGYGQFKVQLYGRWRMTTQGRYHLRKFAIMQKLKRFKK